MRFGLLLLLAPKSNGNETIKYMCIRINYVWLATLFFVSAYAESTSKHSETQQIDTLIINGKVLDGSGNPWTMKDIGIKNDKIVFIGNSKHASLAANQVVDANGLFVAPGFIDMHSHADPENVDTRKMLPQLYQGITTVVLGVDGQGRNDIAANYHRYRDQGLGVNIVSYVGFNAARHSIMGMSGESANQNQIEKMKQYLEAGMQQGAFGVSTGLFYRPATYANTQEVIDTVSVAYKYNGVYDTHDRDMGAVLDGIGYDASIAEAIEIGETTGLPVIFSHFTPQGQHNYGRAQAGIDLINRARAKGVEVVAAQHPYTSTQSSLLAYTIPNWALEGGLSQLLEHANDPKKKEQLKLDLRKMLKIRGGADKLLFVDANHELNGKNLQQVAGEKNHSLLDTIVQIAKTQGDASVMNVGLYDMNNIRLLAQQDWMMTSTDGGSEPIGDRAGHPRDFGAFSKKIRQFVVKEKMLSLPYVVRGMTSLPAQFLGIKNRGRIALGNYADIIVFSMERLKDNATYEDSQQYSEGIEYAFVNGKTALLNGKATHTLSGIPITRAQETFEQEPTAKSMKNKLVLAFGGQAALSKIQTLDARLKTRKLGDEIKQSRTFYDFKNTLVAQQRLNEEESIFVTEAESFILQNRKKLSLEEKRRNRILENMKLNFLYYLRNPDFNLLGPLHIPEHSDLSWWILQVGDDLSPPIGLNRKNGKIQRVLFEDGKYIKEFNYQRLNSGIYWPHQFQLYDGDNLIVDGTYFDVKINETADWLKNWLETNRP